MPNRIFWGTMLLTVAAAQAQPNVNDGRGKEWRQLTDTIMTTPSMAASMCPRDGVSSCSGALNGWTWATADQVVQFFGYYAPAILTNPTGVGGFEYFFPASTFLAAIRPTSTFGTTGPPILLLKLPMGGPRPPMQRAQRLPGMSQPARLRYPFRGGSRYCPWPIQTTACAVASSCGGRPGWE